MSRWNGTPFLTAPAKQRFGTDNLFVGIDLRLVIQIESLAAVQDALLDVSDQLQMIAVVLPHGVVVEDQLAVLCFLGGLCRVGQLGEDRIDIL